MSDNPSCAYIASDPQISTHKAANKIALLCSRIDANNNEADKDLLKNLLEEWEGAYPSAIMSVWGEPKFNFLGLW